MASRTFSHFALACGGALFITVVYNGRFWSGVLAASTPLSMTDVMFLASVFALLVGLHASLLLLVPGIRLLKAVLACCAILGALGAYFTSSYGVGIDAQMVRNVVESDVREARGLFNARLALYWLLLGIVPAVLAIRARVAASAPRARLTQTLGVIAATFALCVVSAAMLGASYASFLREHKALRYLVTPANIVYGVLSQFTGTRIKAEPNDVVDLESPVHRSGGAHAGKPLVMFLVIGETARAANFHLAGYARDTTPDLERNGVDYFRDAWACGTSTAVSLPCMFSGSGRSGFEPGRAARTTNMLDALVKGGVAVEWRDNNSGCKGVCARVRVTDYNARSSASFCNAGGCYDEVMLEDLPAALPKIATDTVIVFHQAGSHGPAYAERYPQAFEVFRPVCRGNELSRCTTDEVRNAYDNSIRYTNHVLARQIDQLKAAAASIDGALVFVSDHGESLGEKGLYLHGAPYAIAPAEQKHVPFLLWLSAGYRERFGVSAECVRASAERTMSHDNLYHTVLGMMALRSARYQPQLDVLFACRSSDGAGGEVVGMR